MASITSTLGVGLTVRDLGGGHSVATGGTAFIKLTDVVGGRSKEDDIAVGDWLVIGNNEEKVKVEFSFGYILDEKKDDLKIIFHHSSIPYST